MPGRWPATSPLSSNTSKLTRARCRSPAAWPWSAEFRSTNRGSAGPELPSRFTNKERGTRNESLWANWTFLSAGCAVLHGLRYGCGPLLVVVAEWRNHGGGTDAGGTVWAAASTGAGRHDLFDADSGGAGLHALRGSAVLSQHEGR